MALPYCILEHENYIRLSGTATKLLIDIFMQYNGKNNGSFKATWDYMKHKRGWRSEETLNLAKQELIHYGFILCVKAGGLRSHSLYAVTWLQIDEADDVSILNSYVKAKVVPSLWRERKETFNKKDYRQSHKKPKEEKPQGTVTPFRGVKRKKKIPRKEDENNF